MIIIFYLGLGGLGFFGGRRVLFFMGDLFIIFSEIHEHEEETKKENRAIDGICSLWVTGGGTGVDFLCH
jgi:hypothetical protein